MRHLFRFDERVELLAGEYPELDRRLAQLVPFLWAFLAILAALS